MKKEIKLEGFVYANGVHWCDASIYNNGYFKRLALVRRSGIIEWDVEPKTLPKSVTGIIEKDAERYKKEFLNQWNRLPIYGKYQRILDCLTITEFVEACKFKTAEEAIREYEKIYFERC